jgi:Retrotransposon gag protein
MDALSNSGERISITRLHGTRVATLAADSTDEESEEEDPKRTTDPRPRSSQTEHGRGLRRPRGTGDDPFTLGDDDDDDDDDVPNGYRYLKGDPPNTFDGDRSRTLTFLAEFNEFMFMNREANIARDPVKKSIYFLSLIKGPNAEWWITHRGEGLEEVEADPTAWQTLEQQFKNDFIDYAGPILAQAEILKLRMKEGNVDQYIDDFKELARRGGHNVDDPSNLRLFAQGLPIRLFKNCIDHESPETFEQWAKAAQRQQKTWLKKQSFRKEASGPSQPPSNPGPTRGQFFGDAETKKTRRASPGNHQLVNSHHETRTPWTRA